MNKKTTIDLKTPEGRRKFYKTPEWKMLRRIKLTHNPFCSECLRKDNHYTIAEDVHHIVDIKEDPTKSLVYDNLESLCKSCHSTITRNGYTKDLIYKTLNTKWDIDKMKSDISLKF